MDNNCHIPHLVHAFPYVENSGLNLVLQLAKPSHLYDSRIKFYYIDNDAGTKQTDVLGKHVKNRVTAVNIVL